MSHQFSGPESYDHVIIDVDQNGNTVKVGEIRIKPNRVMWKAKGKHTWTGVSLTAFSTWIEQNGVDQAK